MNMNDSNVAITGIDPTPVSNDNITDWSLKEFQTHYSNSALTKDDIWEYCYGVMHACDWRKRYRHELAISMPKIPFAKDFEAFRAAGRKLIDLHINYETCPELDAIDCLVDGQIDAGNSNPECYRIKHSMKGRNQDGSKCGVKGDWDSLEINDNCRLINIPKEAHHYKISDRSPLQWAVNQLRYKPDDESLIIDDPNTWHVWADKPFELIRHLRRLAYIGVETHRIVDSLPPSLSE